jgi:polyribonucleotide nucleotidyltransferase
MLLSADMKNDSDILSILVASTALTLSEIPFNGPIAGVRVGRVNGEFVINPTHEEREQSDIDLFYCGTRDLPMMIEGGSASLHVTPRSLTRPAASWAIDSPKRSSSLASRSATRP